MYSSAQFFRIDNFQLSSSELDSLLEPFHFREMTPSQETSVGWVSPYGEELDEESLVRTLDGRHSLLFKISEKKIRPAVIEEQVRIRFNELKKSPMGPKRLDKKTKKELAEAIRLELIPKEPPVSRTISAYIDPENKYFVVEGSNSKAAESIITMLKRAFEAGGHSIGINPIRTIDSVTAVITSWVLDDSVVPAIVELGSKCTLSGPEGQVVKYDRHELTEEKLKKYVSEDSMDVAELQISFDELISFKLSGDLSIRGVKTLDGSNSRFNSSDYDDNWEADFVIMAGVFESLIPNIIEWFGGEDMQQDSLTGATLEDGSEE
ncbi:recombination-associated protein RdgC [Pseudomonas luteola]